MKIQVLGSGCPKCKKLHELTINAVKELDMDIEVEYITDIQKIVEMGIMSSPALAIDNKVVTAGSVSSVDKIKELISEKNNVKVDDSPRNGCSCGGKC